MNTTAIYKCLKCGQLWEIPLIAIPDTETKCPYCGGEGWKIGEFNPNFNSNEEPSNSNEELNIEDYIVSPELAKRLKEVGVDSPSLFYWRRRIWNDGSVEYIIEYEDDIDDTEMAYADDFYDSDDFIEEEISAYMAQDLIEKLPHLIRLREGQQYILCVHKSSLSDGYVVKYERYHNGEIEVLQEFTSRKLSDALAEMLIWWREREGKTGGETR